MYCMLRSRIIAQNILQRETEVDVAQQEAQIQQLAERRFRFFLQAGAEQAPGAHTACAGSTKQLPHLALTAFFLGDRDLLGEREWEWEAAPLRWPDAGDLRLGEAERGRTRPTEGKTAAARARGAGVPIVEIASLAPPLLSTFFLLCAVRI